MLACSCAFARVITWGGNGDDFGGATARDGAGNLYVAGYFSSAGVDFDPGSGVDSHSVNGGRDAYVTKFTADGRFLWARTWGGSGDDTSNGIGVDGAGNVYVSGRFNGTVDFDPGSGVDNHTAPNSPPNNDAFVCKYDPDGNFQWARTWGGTAGDEAYGCTADSAGNVYVVGDFSSASVDFDPSAGTDTHVRQGPAGGFDAFLAKFDTAGSLQWAKTWGGGYYTDGPAVALDGSGQVYVSGMFRNTVDFDPDGGVDSHTAYGGADCVRPFCYNDVFVSKFTADGSLLWVRTWGGGGDDCGYLTVDAAGNVYVAGYFRDEADFNPWGDADWHTAQSNYGAFLSKFDTHGNYQWSRTLAGNTDYAGYSVVLDVAGNLYLTGTFNGTVDLDPGSGIETRVSQSGSKDAFLTKLDANGTFVWAKTWGGSGDDAAYALTMNNALGELSLVGTFANTVDFNPWGVADSRSANHAKDTYLLSVDIRDPATPHPYDADGDFAIDPTELQATRTAWAAGSIQGFAADHFMLWTLELFAAGQYHYDPLQTGYRIWQAGE